MANLSGCFSHKTDDWRTPSDIYSKFMNDGFIDPCPFQAEFDGLKVDYFKKKLFINPPYSNLRTWCDYAIKQHRNGCYVVLLIPARTDTIAFHNLLENGARVEFIKGRLHFNDSKCGAPFPSIFVILE